MSNFSFLEYSFDPYQTNAEDIYSSLNRLGFVQRNQHFSNQASMWTQNQCIILLREAEKIDTPYLSGIGIVQDDIVEFPKDYYDEECSMYVTHDPNGFRILSMPEKTLSKMITHGYHVVDKKSYDTTGLEYFSGVVYNNTSQDVIDFYEQLGFKFTRSSENYNTLMSKNNRFTLLLSKTDDSKNIDTLYVDTNDVFKTTSHFTVAGFDFREYDLSDTKLNFGASLNYKIVGYNCLAFGNQNSYTIENCIKNPIPGFDLIFRSRKQYLHIEEEVIETHYASQ